MISLSALPRICVALGCSNAAQLRRVALDACDRGEEFLEIRLDLLNRPESGIAVIRRLLRRYPDTTILATCRRRANGGQFGGTVAQEIEILDAAVAAGVSLVDIEIETAEGARNQLDRFRGRGRLLVSYHDFERTPPLARVLKRLEKIPADIYKVTTMGRKPSDSGRVLDLLTQHPNKTLVGLVMGEVGIPSRILAPSRHALFTFASPEPPASFRPKRGAKTVPATPTAPGQIPACIMRSRYQAHRRKTSTQIYGVIADPIAHSMSPLVHNRAFQARRIDAVYLPFLVGPTQMGDFFKLVATLKVAGFSVTIPHKQRVIRHLDSVDAMARRIGAVNTVYRRKGRLYGANTDVLGVTVPLEKKLRLPKASVLIVGNGGAARGAIFALRDKGVRVTVTGRNPQKVAALARACQVDTIERSQLSSAHFDVVINTTPVGMYPKIEESFFDGPIPADLVFDMVYNPLETKLLRDARAAGKATIAGLEMFLEQAAAQFEIWTGERAPRTAMRNAVLDELTV